MASGLPCVPGEAGREMNRRQVLFPGSRSTQAPPCRHSNSRVRPLSVLNRSGGCPRRGTSCHWGVKPKSFSARQVSSTPKDSKAVWNSRWRSSDARALLGVVELSPPEMEEPLLPPMRPLRPRGELPQGTVVQAPDLAHLRDSPAHVAQQVVHQPDCHVVLVDVPQVLGDGGRQPLGADAPHRTDLPVLGVGREITRRLAGNAAGPCRRDPLPLRMQVQTRALAHVFERAEASLKVPLQTVAAAHARQGSASPGIAG